MNEINILDWLDILWIPVFALALHKNQRPWAVLFVICNMLMMRMLGELMQWIGYPTGFFPLLDLNLLTRGQLFYCVIHFLYLIIALYAPKSNGAMFISMTISLIFTGAVLFSLVMVL